jgi:CRISPR system Cascade subunit CasE
MYLSRIQLDPKCREARRDLSDPYQLHRTLCRAFSTPDKKCAEGELLWRIEPQGSVTGSPRILVQSKAVPNWAGVGVQGWLEHADPALNLMERLRLDSLKAGQRFLFRLRANPCVTRQGKRLGMLRVEDQEAWIERKGRLHGFSLPMSPCFYLSDLPRQRIQVAVSQGQMLRGRQSDGNAISIYSVLYDGILTVADPERFVNALRTGIGHGKAMGLGLLSVAPIK